MVVFTDEVERVYRYLRGGSRSVLGSALSDHASRVGTVVRGSGVSAAQVESVLGVSVQSALEVGGDGEHIVVDVGGRGHLVARGVVRLDDKADLLDADTAEAVGVVRGVNGNIAAVLEEVAVQGVRRGGGYLLAVLIVEVDALDIRSSVVDLEGEGLIVLISGEVLCGDGEGIQTGLELVRVRFEEFVDRILEFEISDLGGAVIYLCQ